MENVEKNKPYQLVEQENFGSKEDYRYVRLESILRKIRANGWARNEDDRAITEEAQRAIRNAFPDMSGTEAALAVRRLRQA